MISHPSFPDLIRDLSPFVPTKTHETPDQVRGDRSI